MNHSLIINTPLNISHTAVIATLGQPYQQVDNQDTLVLQYNSSALSQAHLLYFQDDKLILKSLYISPESKTLADYINQSGQPERSIFKAAPDTHDSFRLVTHIWPGRGIAVTSAGWETDAPVMRVDEFSPTTLNQYLQTWGKDLVGHQTATIASQAMTLAAPTPAPALPHRILDPLAIGMLGFSLGLFTLFFFLTKRSQMVK